MMRLRRISTLLCPDALQQYPPPHDITVLLGDFNVTVRDDMGVWRGTVGPVSPDPLDDNGLRLVELCRSSKPKLFISTRGIVTTVVQRR